jgi:hypothetical protein
MTGPGAVQTGRERNEADCDWNVGGGSGGGGGYALFGGERRALRKAPAGGRPGAGAAPDTIVAEGRVVPVANAALSLTASGVVARVAAGEGSAVRPAT